MTTNRANFPSLLWPGIRAIWGDEFREWSPLYTRIFTVQTSDKAYEKVQQITGLGLAQVKNETAPIAYINPNEGFSKEYVNITYAIGSSVSEEMYDDDQYQKINNLPKWIARSVKQTREVLAHSVLNNAFGSALSADGVSILNTAHPLVGGGVLSNKLATPADFSQTALQDIMILMGYATDDKGLKMMIEPKMLVVSPFEQFNAEVVLKTDKKVGTEYNDVNPVMGAVPMMVSPYLVDPDAWFLTTDAPEGLTWFDRKKTSFDRDQDFDTKNLKFTACFRAAVGATNWRGLYGSEGG